MPMRYETPCNNTVCDSVLEQTKRKITKQNGKYDKTAHGVQLIFLHSIRHGTRSQNLFFTQKNVAVMVLKLVQTISEVRTKQIRNTYSMEF